jgi:hypothetical protein
MQSKDMMNIPIQDLAIMGINTLEQDNNKVKSYNEKEKVVDREELLPQLIIHTTEEMSAKTFMRNLTSGERFQNWMTQKALIVFKM